jgi:hypothetical protein
VAGGCMAVKAEELSTAMRAYRWTDRLRQTLVTPGQAALKRGQARPMLAAA